MAIRRLALVSLAAALAGAAPALARAPAAAASAEPLGAQLETLQDAAAGDSVKTAALFAFIARNLAALDPDDVGFAISTASFVDDQDLTGKARVAAAAKRWVQHFRARRDKVGELTFLQAHADAQPPGQRLGALRALHRRAAALGLPEHFAARSAQAGIAGWARGLIDEGRYEEAERALGETVAELGGIERVNDDTLARVYGEVLAVQGRGEASDAAFARALAYWQAPGESRAVGRAGNIRLILNQMAYYRNLQRRFADAEEPGRIAADMALAMMGREEIATQKARYNYAVALLGQGKVMQALPYFEEALPLQRKAEGGWTGGGSRDTAILLTTLGRARAQVPGRESDGLAAAVEAADIVRERQRGLPRGGGDGAAAALAGAIAQGSRRNPLSPAFDVVMLAGWAARAQSGQALDAAFRAAQDLTASEAGSAISQAAARDLAGTGVLGALVRERQDIAGRIVANDAAYRSAMLGGDAARTAALGAEQQRLGDRLAAIDTRLGAEFPDYAALVTPRAAGSGEVQAALGPDEALVMLLPSEGHFYAFAVTREALRWNRIDGGAEGVAALVARLRCRLDEATCSPAELEAVIRDDEGSAATPIDDYYPRYDRAAAWRLYQATLAPFAAALAGKKTVYTVASGPVAGLPLAALVTADPGDSGVAQGAEDLLAAPWLGDRHAFVTLPSAAAITLPRARRGASAGTALIGYGAPVLGPAPASARSAGALRRRQAPLRAAAFFAPAGTSELAVDPAKLRKLASLPGTRRELEQLASSFPGQGQSGLRLGPAATEAAVKRDAALPQAAVVVFATHGLLPGEMGLAAEPGLVLTPPRGNGTPTDDGLLTASEAAALDLRARWVILSACNTATADGGGSDALSGLARSFLYAGADSLLASHWRVADDASAALTVQTIRANAGGLGQAAALQAAGRAVRTGRDVQGRAIAEWRPHWAHPAAWAPFSLITDHDR